MPRNVTHAKYHETPGMSFKTQGPSDVGSQTAFHDFTREADIELRLCLNSAAILIRMAPAEEQPTGLFLISASREADIELRLCLNSAASLVGR